jgi:ribosome biogenesis protein Nip4
MPLDLKDPQIRQELKDIIKEAYKEYNAELTKLIVSEYEEPSMFGLQDEKTEKKGKE